MHFPMIKLSAGLLIASFLKQLDGLFRHPNWQFSEHFLQKPNVEY